MTETRRSGGSARRNPWGPPPDAAGDAAAGRAASPDAAPRTGSARASRQRAAAPEAPAAAGAPGEVLFFATRPLRADLGAWGVICAVTLPLLFVDPATWVVAAVSGLVFALAANRRFRFELTASELRLRAGLVGGVRIYPYAEIARAAPAGFDGRPSAGRPRIGFLRIEMDDGRSVAAILHDPADAADALRLLTAGHRPSDRPS
jgi:hypothetical protein